MSVPTRNLLLGEEVKTSVSSWRVNATQSPRPDSPTSNLLPTHRAAQLTATGASDTCSRWAGLAVTGKPEGSAPQFPGSDVFACCSPAEGNLPPRPRQQVYGKVIFYSFQPRALISHVPSHFPLRWEYRDPRNGGNYWHVLSPTKACTSKLPASPDF